MAQISTGDIVKVHYTGKLVDGTIFDSSDGRDPLEFRIGEGQVIPGFEEAVVGMQPGDSKTVSILPEEAYGPYHNEMVMVVDRSQFPEELEPRVGDRLQARQPTGETIILTVTDVNDTSVTLDANHPLAGKELVFDIQVV